MKILVINQHFYPEVASSAQILTELCEDLVKAGHRVTAITGYPSYRMSDTDSISKEKRKKNPVPDEVLSSQGRLLGNLIRFCPRSVLEWSRSFGIEIIRVYNYAPLLREGKWRYVQRMMQYISFFLTSLPVALLVPGVDVVLYLSTPPLLNGITANMLKIVKGTPNVFNIQDLYPDVAIRLGVLRNRVLIDLLHLLEKYLYGGADRIIPIGGLMARCVEDKGVPHSKIEIVPNWMDTEQIHPLGKNTPFAEEHALKDKFVVMYSGNIGLSQGLENVIWAAERTGDLKDLLYLLIGGGESLEKLKRIAAGSGIENVMFLPYQPKDRLSESLSAADVHLLPLKRGLSMFSVPSKVYGIMASGRPFIASVDEDSEISVMIKENDCGVRVEPEDPVALAEAVRALYNDRQRLERQGKNGRAYLEKNITRSICVGRYLSAISEVCKGRPGTHQP